MSVPYGVGTTFFYSLIVSIAFDDEGKANSLLIAGLDLLYLEIEPEIDFPLDLSLPINCQLRDAILDLRPRPRPQPWDPIRPSTLIARRTSDGHLVLVHHELHLVMHRGFSRRDRQSVPDIGGR
jgi:hypothetical protein